MKALIIEAIGAPLNFRDWDDPEPGPGEVVVGLKAAALNHRDLFITQGLYPGIKTPGILGSDGAGLLDGREVVLAPGKNWGTDARVQSTGYEILGMPGLGTFAGKIAVPHAAVHPKPGHLSMTEAAALPLAGLTAYRALFTQGAFQKGHKVLVTGGGGGVALFCLQFAVAGGGEVWVTSGDDEKIDRCKGLGAQGGVNYRETDWHKGLLKAAGEFDLIIDGAGGAGFGNLLRLAKPGGRISVYGGTQGMVPNFSPQLLFWKQLTICGSTMGNDAEFADMLKLVATHRIVPVIDQVFALSAGNEALKRMDQGAQFGKIVLSIP
jgi:zinc-binding alcohol dehydrogenase/oxidoreductase